MARKLKIKVDKDKKKNVDILYTYYINSLDSITRRKLNKDMLNKIYKEIEHYNQYKFRYLAFDSLVVSINKIDKYLKKNVAFHKNIGFEKYLKISEELIKEITNKFNNKILDKNILEIMSANFFSLAIQKQMNIDIITTDLSKDYQYKIENFQIFTKDIVVRGEKIDDEYLEKEEMVLLTLRNKEKHSFIYLEIRKIDYDFLQSTAKLLRIMNLILKTANVIEDEIKFLNKYYDCIYQLQYIVDYIYFKEILSVYLTEIPKYLKIK